MAGLLTMQIEAPFSPFPGINCGRVDLGTGSLLTVAGTATDLHRLPYSPLLKRHHHCQYRYTLLGPLTRVHIYQLPAFRFCKVGGISCEELTKHPLIMIKEANEAVMNLQESIGGEAKLQYGEAEFEILVPGAYVICAVTGVKIPLDSLRYWNTDKQEAYADAAAASRGFGLIDKEA